MEATESEPNVPAVLPALPNKDTTVIHEGEVAESFLDEQAQALKKFVEDSNANGIGSNLDGYAAAQNDKTANIMDGLLAETQQVLFCLTRLKKTISLGSATSLRRRSSHFTGNSTKMRSLKWSLLKPSS